MNDLSLHSSDISQNGIPYRIIYIHAQLPQGVDPDDVYPEDWDATGLWEVLVPYHLSTAQAANCALDGYNSTVPIKRLYMFTLTAIDPSDGRPVHRDDDLDGYALKDVCGDVRFIGHLG